MKRGISISEMIDGSRILNDPDFIDGEFWLIVEKLASAQKVKATSKTNPNGQLNHSKRILLTWSDYQGLDQWARETLMKNLLLHGDSRLEIMYLMQHFETGYQDELWIPLMEYKKNLKKYGYLTIPHLGLNGFTQPTKKMPMKTEEHILEIQNQFLQKLDEVIFSVENGKPLNGWCKFCSPK